MLDVADFMCWVADDMEGLAASLGLRLPRSEELAWPPGAVEALTLPGMRQRGGARREGQAVVSVGLPPLPGLDSVNVGRLPARLAASSPGPSCLGLQGGPDR